MAGFQQFDSFEELARHLNDPATRIPRDDKHHKNGFCRGCEKRKGNLRCSRCHHAFYCCVKCQKKDFTFHQRMCYPLAKELFENENNRVLIEALNLNLFQEYQAKKFYFDSGAQTDLFNTASLMIFGAVIELILIDPIEANGAPTDVESPELEQRYQDAIAKIKTAARLVVDGGHPEYMMEIGDSCFIPRRIKRDIDIWFDGIGGWRG